MSEIQDKIDRFERDKITVPTDNIIEHSSIGEVKEWADYLRRNIKARDERIEDLITENVTLQIRLETIEISNKRN